MPHVDMDEGIRISRSMTTAHKVGCLESVSHGTGMQSTSDARDSTSDVHVGFVNWTGPCS